VTSNIEKSDGLVHRSVKNAVLCENIVKESRKFELARLKKKKKEIKHFGRLATFWFVTFAMLLSATGVLLVMKTLEDER